MSNFNRCFLSKNMHPHASKKYKWGLHTNTIFGTRKQCNMVVLRHTEINSLHLIHYPKENMMKVMHHADVLNTNSANSNSKLFNSRKSAQLIDNFTFKINWFQSVKCKNLTSFMSVTRNDLMGYFTSVNCIVIKYF